MILNLCKEKKQASGVASSHWETIVCRFNLVEASAYKSSEPVNSQAARPLIAKIFA